MRNGVSVLTAPLLDPGHARRELELPEGLSLAEMIATAFPGLAPSDHSSVRVVLVTKEGAAPIDARFWATTRPKSGVRVVIRIVPGKDAARTILLAVVAVAATAFAGPLAGAIFGKTTPFLTAAIGTGLTVVGGLLVNALIPMQTPEQDRRKNAYSISGWANTARQNEPVPDVYGRHRTAPPFAANSYTEVVGDQQFVRALFCVGMGPIKSSDVRIGNTSIDEYDEVEIEIREGRPGDAPISLYPHQVLEQAEGIELVRPPELDDAGEATGGPSVETPVVRQTAADTQDVNVILSFPQGLFAVDDKGRKAYRTITVRIQQRPVGDETWQPVTELEISGLNDRTMYRQYRWQLPNRGKWDIEVTRMTDDAAGSSVVDRVNLAALQSIRPEGPLNIDKPLALIAMRIRATHQLNNALDSVNLIAERYALRWDGTGWSEGLPRNPAAAFIALLQGPSNPFPVADTEIDWEILKDWYLWCEEKGLKYDRVVETGQSFGDLQREICAAGRAFPRHDGISWGVVIDRPQDLVVDHISPRNSEGFSWSRSYFDPPHGFRVSFFDETNDFVSAERLIPWPGHSGDMTTTEEIQIPGKTDPREIWIEARRRMYELIHRPDTFTTSQSGAVRAVTRGDLVMGAYDVLAHDQLAARVLTAEDRLIEIDDVVFPEEGTDLGIRFRIFADEEDTIGASVVRSVVAPVPKAPLLELRGDGPAPAVGDLIHIGPLAHLSEAMVVKGIEAGSEFSSTLKLVPAAPQIDALTDAEDPPDWSGRVGSEIVLGAQKPQPPRLVSLVAPSRYTGGEDPGDPAEPADTTVTIQLAPASGSVAVSRFRVEYRAVGETAWQSQEVAAASSKVHIHGVLTGSEIDLRAFAISYDDTISDPTATLVVEAGTGSAQLPPAIDADAVQVDGGLGHAVLSLPMPASPVDQVMVYRVPYGEVLDRDLHALPEAITGPSGATISYVDGDATRANLLADPSFEGSGWTLGTGWSQSGGEAEHVSGDAGDLSQTIDLTEARTYHFSANVTAWSGGALTPKLTGSTDLDGLPISAIGRALQSFVVPSGQTGLALSATASFVGKLDEVALYLATAATLTPGIYRYYFEPRTVDGLPGPLSDPYQATVL
ncbi:phage tail protein [Tropicibacter sp. R16_0]|uniref:TipJ family phage tail tip protein n=1 Tax=Tropicibacter sp. R16_0 TaxID=2821102 RepID=UPI001ADD1BF0|nr:phage tail protein [Tropicibacter sp. R16_0]MBO9451439.1 phage tail protein [Tropicibacter sp. R16_0]